MAKAAIARPAARVYAGAMAGRLLRLLALLAMLMMPAGMASATAVPMAAASAAGHCDEHPQPADAPADLAGHCAGCSALPTFDLPAPSAGVPPTAVLAAVAITPFVGIEPDTITPPPKLLSVE